MSENEESESKTEKLFKMSLEELMNVKVITAGRSPEKIADIPASVVLITREDIETYGYSSLTEILENIPGLFGINDYDESGMNFGVRGFWSGSANKNMIILVNNVPQVSDFVSNYPLSKIIVPVEAIDRIEIIRGPMSVIYGSGAFYGVINIFTNDSESPNMVAMAAGSQGTQKIFGRATGQEGKLNYSFNASILNTEGIDVALKDMVTDFSQFEEKDFTNSRTKDKLGRNEKYFNLSSAFKDFSLDITHTQVKKKLYFGFPTVEEGSMDYITSTNVTLGIKKELSDAIRVDGKITYSENRDSYSFKDLLPEYYGAQVVQTNAVEGQLNAFISAAPNMDISSGLYCRSIYYADSTLRISKASLNRSIFLGKGDQIGTYAFYTQVNYSPFNKLRIILGGRVEQSPKYQIDRRTPDPNDPKKFITKIANLPSENKIEFIPRVAALFYLNENHIIKFLIGKAINQPSFFLNEKNVFDQMEEENPKYLKPEDIQTYELNYIGSISPRFTLNASLFRNILNNLITRIVKFDTSSGTFNYDSWSINEGKFITNGLEMTLNAEPANNLRFEFSGTYQKTTDKKMKANNPVAYSPDFLGYVKASYTHRYFILALTGNYVGAMETFWTVPRDASTPKTPPPDPNLGKRLGERVPGYFKLNASLRVPNLLINGLYLEARCSNLLNAEIRYPASANNYWMNRGTLGDGRTFLVSLGYKF
ncbi:MAG: TonB-dependent receptor plug domain-containing protein [Candidatus Omnitrophota bacterium]